MLHSTNQDFDRDSSERSEILDVQSTEKYFYIDCRTNKDIYTDTRQQTAIKYIKAYLADVAAQKEPSRCSTKGLDDYSLQGESINRVRQVIKTSQDKETKSIQQNSLQLEDEWQHIDRLLKANMALPVSDEKIVRDRIIHVMKKLGEAKLKGIQSDTKNMKNVSLLEKIGHYINKLIRAVTFGLAGHKFSDKEAKEALNSGLDAAYDENDRITRFAQVVKKDSEKRDPAQQEFQKLAECFIMQDSNQSHAR
jgi:hypothetical protein